MTGNGDGMEGPKEGRDAMFHRPRGTVPGLDRLVCHHLSRFHSMSQGDRGQGL
jgi:hypothetical protein